MNHIKKGSIAIFLVGLSLALCLPLTCFAEKMKEGAPKISPIEPHYDFGETPEGKDVEHIFKIRNTGESDLVIHQAKGS